MLQGESEWQRVESIEITFPAQFYYSLISDPGSHISAANIDLKTHIKDAFSLSDLQDMSPQSDQVEEWFKAASTNHQSVAI